MQSLSFQTADFMDAAVPRVPVLYEDESIFVFNKPAGLAVQGGAGVKTSFDAVLSKHFSPRPLLIHRLDKETSGVLVVAKNKQAAAHYSKIIEKKDTEKYYTAVCVNSKSLKENGEINEEINVKGDFKSAKTIYKKIYSNDDFAFISIKIMTGRTHQIRRHLSFNGAPVLGDDKYGDFKLNKKLKKEMGLKKLLLHASKIILFDNGKKLEVEAPLPEYFEVWEHEIKSAKNAFSKN